MEPAAKSTSQMPSSQMDASHALENCIKKCWDTRHHVQTMLNEYCLPKGGDHADAGHVAVMMDCVEICQVAADFMTRNSPTHTAVCAACAVICDAAADSCASFATDREMLHCADICRACAESCRAMAHSTATTTSEQLEETITRASVF